MEEGPGIERRTDRRLYLVVAALVALLLSAAGYGVSVTLQRDQIVGREWWLTVGRWGTSSRRA